MKGGGLGLSWSRGGSCEQSTGRIWAGDQDQDQKVGYGSYAGRR